MPSSKMAPIVAITNLYPLPWEPTRAAFNKQQFDGIAQHRPLKVAVLLPLLEWLKHHRELSNDAQLKYIPHLHIPKIGTRLTPFFQYLALRFNRKWLMQTKPALLYGCWLFPDAVAVAKIADEWGVECVLKAHGTDVNVHAKDKRKRQQMQSTFAKVKHIFCPSNALKQTLVDQGFEANLISVNYNGVNKTVFYPNASAAWSKSAGRPVKLIFVGSLIQTKGIFELVSALEMIKQRYSIEFNLTVVGQGAQAEQLVEVVKQKGLLDCIQFVGPQALNSVAELIRESDFLVLPSYREGLPNVVLEAFSSGVPVIASNVGGIPEVVNKRVGIIVEAKSSISLAEGLKNAVETSWNKNDICTHALDFDWDKNVHKVLDHATLQESSHAH